MSPRLRFALEIAYTAGRSTLALFKTGAAVSLKSDSTPVTEADKHAEQLIRRAIHQRYKEDGILGEEEGESGDQSARWVVDPIDGTKSFICGVPLYATLLSYEVDRVPVLGVSYFPALDEMVYAEKGEGAFRSGRPCQVSSKCDLSSATLCCGSHVSMDKCGRAEGFLSLARQARASRTWGDAYGHALVATGRVEAMLDPVVSRWDISAMQIIVSEAGGRFTDFVGVENPNSEAVSSNGHVHNTILETYRP